MKPCERKTCQQKRSMLEYRNITSGGVIKYKMAKSIVEKLNLHKYSQVAVLNAPEGSDYLVELTGYDTELRDHHVYDLIFAFVLDMDSLKALVDRVIANQHLQTSGYLFAAYPKKGNKVYPTFIHRDELLEGLGSDENGYIGTSNIKFARMVGMDSVYRKDWARYVYSAKQEETIVKRREEMKMILRKGYKSRELHRRDQP